MKLSVIIICKNERHVIAGTIRLVQPLTDDIVVVDSGSTDGTVELLQQLPVRLVQITWTGFGDAKNTGIDAARYDWILSLDADEQPDAQLLAATAECEESNTNTVFELPFRTYLGDTPLRYGEWGHDAHIRIFNRVQVRWNNAAVHEQLVLPANVVVKKIKGGYVHHRTSANAAELHQKMDHYARLNALKYYRQGKKTAGIKKWLSPAFNFFNHYLLRGGFLDGAAGWVVARESARYTWLKYHYLQQMNRGNMSV